MSAAVSFPFGALAAARPSMSVNKVKVVCSLLLGVGVRLDEVVLTVHQLTSIGPVRVVVHAWVALSKVAAPALIFQCSTCGLTTD